MAKEAGAAALASFRYSTVSIADIAANGKTIVCLQNITFPTTADVQTEDTFCGEFESVGSASHEFSGEGVNVGNKAANEVNAQDIKALMQAKTGVYFIATNAADGGIDAGELMHAAGFGHFTNAETTFEHPGMSKFSWSFKPRGADLDLTP